MENFQYLIFVSENSRKEWTTFEKLKYKKSFYIPNCSDEEMAREILTKSKEHFKDKVGYNQSKFNVVCVANLMKRKGQDILINNFSN